MPALPESFLPSGGVKVTKALEIQSPVTVLITCEESGQAYCVLK
jgi:hypothetical protein